MNASSLRNANREIRRAENLARTANYIENSFDKRIAEIERKIEWCKAERERICEDMKKVPDMKKRAASLLKAAQEARKAALDKIKRRDSKKPTKQSRQEEKDAALRELSEKLVAAFAAQQLNT